MKIYKFKDFTDQKKHTHFYQIVLENSIWGAKPDSLNDEEEFKFSLDYKPSPRTAALLSRVIDKYKATDFSSLDIALSTLKNHRLEIHTNPIIKKITKDCRELYGITSFSLSNRGDHLWTEYGGNGNGACIEIDIPDELIGKSYHQVNYVFEKVFHVDSLLEYELYPDKIYINILSTKRMTSIPSQSQRYQRNWLQEQEIRYISKYQGVLKGLLNMNGCHITEITFGARVPAQTFSQIQANIVSHCNENSIKIKKL